MSCLWLLWPAVMPFQDYATCMAAVNAMVQALMSARLVFLQVVALDAAAPSASAEPPPKKHKSVLCAREICMPNMIFRACIADYVCAMKG